MEEKNKKQNADQVVKGSKDGPAEHLLQKRKIKICTGGLRGEIP